MFSGSALVQRAVASRLVTASAAGWATGFVVRVVIACAGELIAASTGEVVPTTVVALTGTSAVMEPGAGVTLADVTIKAV